MTSASQTSPRPATASRHLLVVDDMEMNRDLMTLQLQRHGYEVSTVENGPQALACLAQQGFDLVLLDIRMPEMDGLEVLRRIRQSHSALSLPVIMVTAEDQQERIIEALQLGANDYLVKPLNLPVALARIEAQLALSRMAGIKDEVLRFASHDLKKPLLVMLDIAETLKAELAAGSVVPADAAELLELIVRTGTNMQQVISGFLDQEAWQQDQAEAIRCAIDLNDVARRSVNANRDYAARKNVALSHQFTALPPVQANEFRLLQILDNLIGNALKFCPPGATTWVCTGADADTVFVEIIDDGPGLQDEDFPKLFVKQARLSNRPTGNESSSGVGLAMCKQLIELDGGQIGARNNPQGGATFWIRLPRVSAQQR
jgi:two-component system sensor histidine kinase/response regulator